MKHNATLTTLDLSANAIKAKGAQAIIEMLKHNTTLTSIYLDDNRIGTKNLRTLAEILKYNTTLTSIGLRNTSTHDDKGIRAIAEALKHNTTLKFIDLSDDQISIQCITEALKYNTTLTSICFSYKCSTWELQLIVEALQYNTTLTSISFYDYFDDDDGSAGDDYNRLRLEIYEKTEQNRAIEQYIKKCHELWILEKRVCDFFLQWLPREVLEDTLDLLINKKNLPLVENSQFYSSPLSPSFFKRKREEGSPRSPFSEEGNLGGFSKPSTSS